MSLDLNPHQTVAFGCITSDKGLYGKFIPMMSRKCSVVENNGELMLMAVVVYTLEQRWEKCVFAFLSGPTIDLQKMLTLAEKSSFQMKLILILAGM